MYKIQQNELNLELSKEEIDKKRLSAYSNIINESKLESTVCKFNKSKLTYDSAKFLLIECRQNIIDYSSQAALVHASHLISATAVLALLNRKRDDL